MSRIGSKPSESPYAIALGRHPGTEVAGHGASPGTHLLFELLDRILGQRHSTLRIPAYYYGMDARQSVAIAIDVLSRVEACIFGLPPHPADLDAFFLVRDKLQKRIPFIYLPLGEFPRGAWTYRHIHRRLGADDLLLFSCSADRTLYESLVASAPTRSLVLPFGIDLAPYRAARQNRETVRKDLSIEAAEAVFVVHGRLIPEKNPQGALLLFRQLAESHPKCRLWVIGSPPHEQGRGPGARRADQISNDPMLRPFRELLGDGQVAKRVWFWGAVSRDTLPDLLCAADVSVNLTVYDDENFGFSTVEAMAAGLPVVGTHWGGLKDTIEDGVTGFSVATTVTERGVGYDQRQALASAFRLAGDPALRRSMAAASVKRAERLYSLRRFGRELDGAIAGLVERPRRPIPEEHRWTPLGERLADGYSRQVSTGALSAESIPPTADRLVRHPILCELMAHYATPGSRPGDDFIFPSELWGG